MENLPVSEVFDEIQAALSCSPVVLLSAPTGAGKSTWLPLQLLPLLLPHERIIMLEPRRLAAKNVAYRLAQQLGEEVGNTIGYRMRLESRVSEQTRLIIVTEGIMTRMLQDDPMLEKIALVILDECHERNLQADLALALLLDVQQSVRPDLKLLLMSATLETTKLNLLFPEAPYICSSGRSYPVKIQYVPFAPQYSLAASVARVVRQLMKEEEGSVLVFLPGIREIKQVLSDLQAVPLPDTDYYPLYGALSLQQQQLAIQPAAAGRRKVVLATNIAETSLTIAGIRLVVDSGMERVARFNVKSGITRLETQRISQASMQQRAGRAGRVAAGICWHLISKEQAERARAHIEPEILSSDLSQLLLETLSWGTAHIEQLTWLDEPPLPALTAARQLLKQLGAVDQQGLLTKQGGQMAALGCDPRLAAMLLAGKQQGGEALSTAALLAAILEDPPRDEGVDITVWLMQVKPHWKKRARQLERRLAATQQNSVNSAWAPYLLACAFPDRIAQQRGQPGHFLLANGTGAESVKDPAFLTVPWLIGAHLQQTTEQSNTQILLATAVDINELIVRLPQLVKEQTTIEWDQQRGTLRAWHRKSIGRLILSSVPAEKPTEQEIQKALIEWIRENGLQHLNWDHQAEQLRLRLLCARQWMPELSWPVVDEEHLLAELESWLLPFMAGVCTLQQLKKINLSEALLQKMDWQVRQHLEKELPTHYVVPTGSRLPIRYVEGQPPVLAVRLQEMFGERESPRIAEGRVTLVLELLSPARRPLQITSDLSAFWQGAYQQVKKEMKGRYPKHSWPDDPANSRPTRQTKRVDKSV